MRYVSLASSHTPLDALRNFYLKVSVHHHADPCYCLHQLRRHRFLLTPRGGAWRRVKLATSRISDEIMQKHHEIKIVCIEIYRRKHQRFHAFCRYPVHATGSPMNYLTRNPSAKGAGRGQQSEALPKINHSIDTEYVAAI